LPVTIFDANAHTLFGEVVTRHSGLELFTLSAPKRSEPTGQKEALSVLK
jgi:hypothetical protein